MPERTRPAGAFGYGLPVKAEALQTLRFDGASRRAFPRPSSHEMATNRLGGRRQPSGACSSDFLAKGSILRFCCFHSPPLCCVSAIISASTSLARNPDARTRPGSLRFVKRPLAAILSTNRKLRDSRRATSARRTRRGSVEISSADFCATGSRKVASSRARSWGVSVGSAFNPDRTISSVVLSIISFWRSLRLLLA